MFWSEAAAAAYYTKASNQRLVMSWPMMIVWLSRRHNILQKLFHAAVCSQCGKAKQGRSSSYDLRTFGVALLCLGQTYAGMIANNVDSVRACFPQQAFHFVVNCLDWTDECTYCSCHSVAQAISLVGWQKLVICFFFFFFFFFVF